MEDGLNGQMQKHEELRKEHLLHKYDNLSLHRQHSYVKARLGTDSCARNPELEGRGWREEGCWGTLDISITKMGQVPASARNLVSGNSLP